MTHPNEISLSSSLFIICVVLSLMESNLCNVLFFLDGVIEVYIYTIFALFRKQNPATHF